MKNQNYKIYDKLISKKYVLVLEELTINMYKALPSGYEKLTRIDDKINLLEGKVLKILNKRFYGRSINQ